MTKLFKDIGGNVAMLFGLMALGITIVIGMTVDYNRQYSAKNHLQAAVDAAALSGARMAMLKQGSRGEIKKAVEDSVRQNYASQGAADIKSIFVLILDPSIPIPFLGGATFGDGGDTKRRVIVTAKADLDASVTAIMGADKLRVKTSSTAIYGGSTSVEAVLVLDNSFSMAGGYLTALQDASNDFVDNLMDGSDTDTKIGIVPFNNYVNVGVENRYASWMSVDSKKVETTSVEQCTLDAAASEAAGCSIVTNTCTTDGMEVSCSSWQCPTGVSTVKNCEWVDKTKTTDWYGCVESRPYPLNIEDVAYFSDKVVGRMDTWSGHCPAKILPLSSIKSVVKTRISELDAKNDTYLATGISWGLRVLSPEKPFVGGSAWAGAGETDKRRIMVVMSDGANTRSPDSFSGNRFATDIDLANTYTAEVCEEAKSKGVEIFTVAFRLDDEETLDILRDCSSDGTTHFMKVENSAALVAAFNQISQNLNSIAIEK